MVSVTLARRVPLHGHNSLRMSRVIGLDLLDYVIDDDPLSPRLQLRLDYIHQVIHVILLLLYRILQCIQISLQEFNLLFVVFHCLSPCLPNNQGMSHRFREIRTFCT